MQNELRRFNETDLEKQKTRIEKAIIPELPESQAHEKSQKNENIKECEWCRNEINGQPYTAKFRDTYGTATRVSESYFCN